MRCNEQIALLLGVGTQERDSLVPLSNSGDCGKQLKGAEAEVLIGASSKCFLVPCFHRAHISTEIKPWEPAKCSIGALGSLSSSTSIYFARSGFVEVFEKVGFTETTQPFIFLTQHNLLEFMKFQ